MAKRKKRPACILAPPLAQVHLLVPKQGAASATTAAVETAGAAQGAARCWGAAMSSDQDPECPVEGNDSPGEAAVFSL